MEKQNRCVTYFRMVGQFDPDRVTEILGLQPEKCTKVGDVLRNGKKSDVASWEIGRCDVYDPIVANQMKRSISLLRHKVDALRQIKETYEVSYYLEVVPEIHAEGVHPCLSPDLDIIDFCHATRCEIDIDMYILTEEE